jgi:hypothetical protein
MRLQRVDSNKALRSSGTGMDWTELTSAPPVFPIG